MKTFFIPLLIAVFFSSFTANAQQKVALHSNGVTTIFGGTNPFTNAYNAASTGDTIYLPGGNLSLPAAIDKGLVIIGAGHYPDSTMATTKTVLVGNLTISQNADNLHIEGVEISGNISFTTNHKVDFVKIKRCKFSSLTYPGTRTTPSENNEITECVIVGNIDLSNSISSLISNSIIHGQILKGLDMGFSNNILFFNSAFTFRETNQSIISNNIFMTSSAIYVHYLCESNTFIKNVFAFIPSAELNNFIDNYNSVVLNTVFVNQSGYAFNYAHDYHLNTPASYLGTDGSQVGIYGGMFPYKEGAVPNNPHFQIKNIAPQTDVNGDLNIQIQVEAQDN